MEGTIESTVSFQCHCSKHDIVHIEPNTTSDSWGMEIGTQIQEKWNAKVFHALLYNTDCSYGFEGPVRHSHIKF
jgi:hypothetical protein